MHHALTRNIALQYAPANIRANCVLPGLMNTPMIRKPKGDEKAMIEKRNQQCPIGHTGCLGDCLRSTVLSLK
jgi:NAD(P)-dependent dehydrogenase (short-subunit alcohol dehydrogenase family)